MRLTKIEQSVINFKNLSIINSDVQDNKEIMSEGPVTKDQLSISLIQLVDELAPLDPGTMFQDIAVEIYELKKKIMEIDSEFKFRYCYNNHIFRILNLLDLIDTSKPLCCEHRIRQEKICQMMHKETKYIRQFNPE